MKKTSPCVKGARLLASSRALKTIAADAKATVTAADAATAIATGEWKAEGAIYDGELVINAPVKICGLVVRGTVRVTALAAGTTLCCCRIEGETGIVNEADDLTVLNTVILFKKAGIVDNAKSGTVVRDCQIEGEGVAVATAAESAQIMYNTVKGSTGIALGGGVNMIAAMNASCGPITADGAKNTVILKNSMCCAEVKNCHAVYVIENKLKGALTATNNNYIIADCNCTGKDTVQEGNENQNGNNLMDVDARLPYGADENLLPHVDKDLFVGMERKTVVRDPDGKSELPLAKYINNRALNEEVIIVPPGAYCSDEAWSFPREASNTTVYAYGVYAERQKDIGCQATFRGAKNVTLKGITFAFKQQSCGQVFLLEKLGMEEDDVTGWVRVVTGAGLMDEFGDSNKAYYNTKGMGAQRMGTFYAYMDAGFWTLLETEEDGTRRMRVAKDVYNRLAEGDILTCRGCNGGTTIPVEGGCENIIFYDLTMYGGAAGFAWVEHDNKTATTYYRVLNTTRSGEIIDEETYNKYRAYEKKYNVSTEVYQDELGRYRGSPCHIGSIDATHTTRCAQGSVCIACLFENMCDDGTNQNHTHGRIAAMTDNGDGTTTVLYKGCLSMFSYNYRGREKCTDHNCRGLCAPFSVGDRVYVYNSAGQLVCDTPALTATVDEPAAIAPEYNTEMPMRSVTVATSAVNFKALEGYDLSRNTPDDRPGDKVLIDNMSLASNGFIFDNVLVRNIRSRGLLIKASDSKIINCSFKNIGMSCAAILYEIFWGESGVTENMLVTRNLFDHTGYFRNIDRYAPISVEGLGSQVDEDYLLYKNIIITDNVIKNRTTDYAVYINSAKGVVIKNNDFGTVNELGNKYERDIHLNGAMNIEISDNTYSNPDITPENGIFAEHIKNIYGSDVVVNGKTLYPDAE
ncbi:MAG: hypothetical protein IJY20_08775 [Clostridia bacterium]|nr:hypothetical protein [Clostridia bacterium]